MLTGARLKALTALALVAILAAWAAAPAASAAPVGHGALAMPASAAHRLSRELLSAWQITRGQGVTVAVLSTRVDAVTGLAGKLSHGPDYVPLAGAPATDGTLLASLIAGSGPSAENVLGSLGRAPGARILAETIANWGAGRRNRRYQADGTWQVIAAKAIRYAASHGAGVIVTDESGSDDTPGLASAVAYAESKNAVIVSDAFASTRSPASPEYPDDLPGVINYTGTPLGGLPKPPQPPQFPVSSSVLVTAPDNPGFATGPGNLPYTPAGGYSALAWVAGTVALIKSVYPKITPAQVARALAISASYHPHGGYNTTVGFGLINPSGALHAAGRLVKLRSTAAAGPAVVNPTSRLARGSVPGIVDAVHHAPARLAVLSAVIVAGLAVLLLALWLARRWRRASPRAPRTTP